MLYPLTVLANVITTLSCPVVLGALGAVLNVTTPVVLLTVKSVFSVFAVPFTVAVTSVVSKPLASNVYFLSVPFPKKEFFLLACNTFTG